MLENVGQTPTPKISHLKGDLETGGKGWLSKYFWLLREGGAIESTKKATKLIVT